MLSIQGKMLGIRFLLSSDPKKEYVESVTALIFAICLNLWKGGEEHVSAQSVDATFLCTWVDTELFPCSLDSDFNC